MNSPLPWGEGVPLPALSSAGAGRVRGHFIAADEPVSRKDAKFAKAAKKTADFHLAFLCDFASWRELFWFGHAF
jgi:hypothetical protein